MKIKLPSAVLIIHREVCYYVLKMEPENGPDILLI